MPRDHLTYPEELWAGTEHSLDLAIDVHEKITAGSMSGFLKPAEQIEAAENAPPRNFSLQGNVGVISIKGSITNNDSPWNALFGITSYPEIRRALMYAASTPEVKGILLDIASGGGAVNGVSDTSELISNIDKKLKPVYAFTDSSMASAAYWLGSSARKVFNSKLSMVGSVGVIATHMEYSKRLKDEGIGATVIRAGKYKALANSIEPLSDAAEKQIQNQLDAAYKVFVEHVADARGVDYDTADQKMGQGREFFGEAAVDAGLTDGIRTFDRLMSELHARLLDSEMRMSNNPTNLQKGGLPMTRKALTEQEIAALAAAGAVEAVAGDPAPAAEVQAPAPAAEAAPEVTEPEKEKAPAEAAQPSVDVVAFLQGQLSAAQNEVVDLKVQLKTVNDKVASMQATHDGLVAVVSTSLSNMRVALRLPAVDCSKMSTEALLAEHAATAETVKKQFKAGGVAAVNAPEKSETAQPDPHHKARVAATRLTN